MRFLRRQAGQAVALARTERTELVCRSASLRGVSEVRLTATLLGDGIPGLKVSHIGHTFRAMVLSDRLTESETARAQVSLRVRNTRVTSGWFCRIEADVGEHLACSTPKLDVALTYWLHGVSFKAANRHDVCDGLFTAMKKLAELLRGGDGDRVKRAVTLSS